MKQNRHEKIVELIDIYEIETQEELADKAAGGGLQCDAGNGIPGYQAASSVQGPGRERQAENTLF